MERTSSPSQKRFRKIKCLGKGSYGTVYKAQDTHCQPTPRIVALKKIRLRSEDEGVPATAIKEISLLLNLNHSNVLKLFQVIHGDSKLTLVFEYLETDLKKYMESSPNLPLNQVKSFMLQLLLGIKHCHSQKVIHRDLKPANLLVNVKGELKLGDFGLARLVRIPTANKSHEVVTLWYREPAVLLGSTKYGNSIDLWSAGCIFLELLSDEPLFPGMNPKNQLDIIFRKLGFPNENTWPGYSELPAWPTYWDKLMDKKQNQAQQIGGDDDSPDGGQQAILYVGDQSYSSNGMPSKGMVKSSNQHEDIRDMIKLIENNPEDYQSSRSVLVQKEMWKERSVVECEKNWLPELVKASLELKHLPKEELEKESSVVLEMASGLLCYDHSSRPSASEASNMKFLEDATLPEGHCEAMSRQIEILTKRDRRESS